MSDCIFCQIVNKQAQAHVIYEDEQFIAFLSIFPNTEGVTVVIPKVHHTSYIFDAPQQIVDGLMACCRKVAKKLDSYFEDVGRTAIIFEGFGIDHLHAKLFPMHGTQHLLAQWQPVNSNIDHYFCHYEGYISSHDGQRCEDEVLAQLAEKIRSI